jgi:hypothetical protein
VFSLHYISLIYLLTIAAGVTRLMRMSIDAATMTGYALLLSYLIRALKRVYSESTAVTLWKAGVLIVLTFTLDKATSLAASRLTLALV